MWTGDNKVQPLYTKPSDNKSINKHHVPGPSNNVDGPDTVNKTSPVSSRNNADSRNQHEKAHSHHHYQKGTNQLDNNNIGNHGNIHIDSDLANEMRGIPDRPMRDTGHGNREDSIEGNNNTREGIIEPMGNSIQSNRNDNNNTTSKRVATNAHVTDTSSVYSSVSSVDLPECVLSRESLRTNDTMNRNNPKKNNINRKGKSDNKNNTNRKGKSDIVSPVSSIDHVTSRDSSVKFSMPLKPDSRITGLIKVDHHSLDCKTPPLDHRGSSKRIHNEITGHGKIWQIIREDLVSDLRHQLKISPELITATDNAGNTPVHIASKYNRLRSLTLLLQKDADPNICGPYDLYPLHLAAKYNSVDAAKYLLHHGANVQCRDCKQKTPLHHAARKGHQDMIELLLFTEGCDLEARDEDNLTPLHEACQLKQQHIAKYLIDHGANINARDISDATPLLFAAAEGLTEVITIILEKAMKMNGEIGKMKFLGHVDNEGTSALHLAVQNNQVKAIDMLLKYGAEINLQNNTNYSALHMAVISGHLVIVNQLLDNGADMEIRDGDHMTPIHRCAMYGKKDVLALLIQKGASINARTSEQMTPLLVAAWKGHVSVVEVLLQNHAKMLATDSCMRTVLHWAVDQGHYNVLQILMKNGGEILLRSRDHLDQTVAHYAARTGNTMMMRLLLDYGVDLDARDQDAKTPLHVASEFGNFNSIEILIDTSHSEVNDGDSDGRTPLMLACLNGHCKATRSLLALGADNSIRDENYCTALLLAASKGHVRVINLLIENLAEVNVSDKLKNTALHMSAAGGHVDAVRLLLNNNASPSLLNIYRKSALDMALDYDHVEVAVDMIKHKKWRKIMSVRDISGYTPMKKLIIKAPEAAQVLMDACVEESDHRKDDIDYTIRYDYKYVDPGPDDPTCKDRRYFALDTMIEYNREDLLSHPLTQSMLIMKWRKFGRWILYGNLFIYAMYVAALNVYMTIMPPMASSILDYARHCPIYLSEEEAANETLVEQLKRESKLSHRVVHHPALLALQIMLEVFILVLLFKELFMLWGQKWRYFVNQYTYFNWVMMASTLIFINPPNKYPCETNWRASWISSLCAWTLLISYLQRLDVVGIYFVMFGEVMKSIFKVMLVLILFIMAFAQAFAAVIARVPGFREQDFFPLTVLAMTLGEIGYIDWFVEQDNYPFSVDSCILITLFMIIMPIALMNLLIGIAVGDIDKIQKQAYIKRIGLQSDQVNDSENRLPDFFQRKLYQRYFTIKPNSEKSSRWARLKYHLFGIQTTIEFIAASEKDFTSEALQEIQKNVAKNRAQLTAVTSKINHQQDLVQHLCDHFNIDTNRRNYETVSLMSDRTDMPTRFDMF